ncbi:hypothetical protein OIU78_008630 [Salix suchowensis]|nr:hypothetical protein OIU78_008630 [Salix suchowensis]KAJ6346020.1 hypothetical protein OIU78_008630 [Salix suchowensis]KAJ6346021.1 hypothetical protein OIU78_008630 [Salix suchowensis]
MKQYQSDWMSHWTHTGCRKANEAPKRLGDDSGEVSDGRKHHQSLSGPEMEKRRSKFARLLGEVNDGKGIDFMKDNRTTSPKKLRNEVFEGQSSLPMFKPYQDRDSVLSLKNGVSLGRTADYYSLMPGQAPPELEIQKRKPQFQAEDTNLAPEQQVKSNSLLERFSKSVSTPIEDDFVRSTAVIVPCEFEGRRAPIQSFSSGLDHINEPGCTSLVHEKKMNRNNGLLSCDPSTSNIQLRDFFGKSFQTVPNHSDFELFSRQISPRDNSKLEKLYHGTYALPSLPSVHDVDSIEEFSRGPPKFTQTTHRFFITKKTDVNLPDGAQIFRGSATSTEFKGKMVSGLLALSPDFGFHVKQGVQIQPLGSTTESTENVKTSAVIEENDSSAETDAMDIHAFCENHLSGVASLQSDKDINEGQKSPASQAGLTPVRQETNCRQMNTELPDIKQELPVLTGVAMSPDDMEASTSRTQSLDVECFLPRPEHSINSKSSDCHDAPSRLDPYSRWVKRLKPSASDSFGYGTKSLKVEEASSHRKINKLFSKTPRHRKNISEPKKSKSCGTEQAVTDQTAESPRNAESISTDLARKSQEITLSHAWVRRWCHNPSASPKKKPEAVVVSEPECSEATLDLQKKQFPSIAAMALMGKAMNGFRSCEFRKQGSSVVWNTRGFRDELS